jgi:hypothetical protein
MNECGPIALSSLGLGAQLLFANVLKVTNTTKIGFSFFCWDSGSSFRGLFCEGMNRTTRMACAWAAPWAPCCTRSKSRTRTINYISCCQDLAASFYQTAVRLCFYFIVLLVSIERTGRHYGISIQSSVDSGIRLR